MKIFLFSYGNVGHRTIYVENITLLSAILKIAG
jgi:hypothetical protein